VAARGSSGRYVVTGWSRRFGERFLIRLAQGY
jgi:hypothetical protein